MIAYVLTLMRPVLAGLIAVVVGVGCREHFVDTGWAIVLLALVGVEELSDLFDGYFARRGGTVSKLGGILDPLADSVSRLTIYFAMALVGWVMVAVPLVMVLRDITAAYCRIARATTGESTSARVSGKIKAVVQGVGIFGIIVAAWLTGREHLALGGGVRVLASSVVLAVTLWSMLDYLRGALPALKRMKDMS